MFLNKSPSDNPPQSLNSVPIAGSDARKVVNQSAPSGTNTTYISETHQTTGVQSPNHRPLVGLSLDWSVITVIASFNFGLFYPSLLKLLPPAWQLVCGCLTIGSFIAATVFIPKLDRPLGILVGLATAFLLIGLTITIAIQFGG